MLSCRGHEMLILQASLPRIMFTHKSHVPECQPPAPTTLTMICSWGMTFITTPVLSHLVGYRLYWFCMATGVPIGKPLSFLAFLASFSPSTSLDLAIILSFSSWEMHQSSEAAYL